MMHGDPSPQACKAAAEAAKSSVRLQSDNQSPKYSGHESAPVPEGGPAAAGPSGKAPGTRG